MNIVTQSNTETEKESQTYNQVQWQPFSIAGKSGDTNCEFSCMKKKYYIVFGAALLTQLIW